MARFKLGSWSHLLWLALQAAGLESGNAGIAGADDGAAKATGPAVGEVLPGFEALNEQGSPWKSAEYTGKKAVVIYFYPGDFTGGYIKHAQKFPELVEKFREAGAEVLLRDFRNENFCRIVM